MSKLPDCELEELYCWIVTHFKSKNVNLVEGMPLLRGHIDFPSSFNSNTQKKSLNIRDVRFFRGPFFAPRGIRRLAGSSKRLKADGSSKDKSRKKGPSVQGKRIFQMNEKNGTETDSP